MFTSHLTHFKRATVIVLQMCSDDATKTVKHVNNMLH